MGAREGTCQWCKRHVRLITTYCDICDPCFRRAPKTRCNRCQHMRIMVDDTTGMCVQCTKTLQRHGDDAKGREGTCTTCKRRVHLPYENQDICATCVKYAPKKRCSGCLRIRINVDEATGICPQCRRSVQLGQETGAGKGTCRKCRRQVGLRKHQDICQYCYKLEPKQRCSRCQHMRCNVDAGTGMCPKCRRALAKATNNCRDREGECLVCHRYIRLPIKGRDICHTCHQQESSQRCTRCNQMKHTVAADTGLCVECPEAVRQGRQQRPFRDIQCEVCGRVCQTQQKDRDICHTCHAREPSAQCRRCKRMRHDVDASVGLCGSCVTITHRPKAPCARCSGVEVIFDMEHGLCQYCHILRGNLERWRARQEKPVACSVCGQLVGSVLAGRLICRPCYDAGKRGLGECSRCGENKKIEHKQQQLCKLCDKETKAAESLRKYSTSYMTLYAYNTRLFNLLISRIDWDDVPEKVNRRLRAFGKFLQAHPLPEPLTWEAIEDNLPWLPPTNRNVPKQIRASLLDLGHALAAAGLLETREVYLARRRELNLVEKASAFIRPLLHDYRVWLHDRQTTSENVINHLDKVIAFWSWCEDLGVTRLETVPSELIKQYLLSLKWQIRCGHCQLTQPLGGQSDEAQPCRNCGASDMLTKEKRCAPNTIRTIAARYGCSSIGQR